MVTASGVFSARSRYSLVITCNQVSQSIPNNTSNVSVLVQVVETTENGTYSGASTPWNSWVNGSTNSGTFTYDFRDYDVLTLLNTSKTIAHNADGTKSIWFEASVTASAANIGTAYAGKTLVLSTIPRASTPSWASGTPASPLAGGTYTLNTNRASTSFTHTITYTFGNATGTIGTGVAASVSWTIPLSLLNEIPNATSGNGTITTKTYNGSTLIGTKNTPFTITADTNIVPTWTSVSTSEGVPLVTTKVGSVYVQGVSKVTYAINGAAGVYSSTISDRRLEVAGQTVLGASGTTPSAISASGTVPAVLTITDSRGRKKTQTNNLTVLAYSNPTIVSSKVERATSGGVVAPDSGTSLKVTVNATVKSLVNGTQKNSMQIKVRSRLTGSTTPWTDPTTLKYTVPSISGITYNSSFVVPGPFAVDASYEVRVEVIDVFNTSGANTTVSVAKIFMHWDESEGVGIGKYRENGALDVGGDTYSTRVRVTSAVEATLASTTHGFQVGADNSTNLVMDTNEMQARSNGSASQLSLNPDGGGVAVGNSSSVLSLNGPVLQPVLPEPQVLTGVAIDTITASTWAPVPSLGTIVLTLPRACWVQVDYGAWMAAPSGDVRCGLDISGATTLAPPDFQGNTLSGWGMILWSSGLYEQRSATKTVKLNAGTTTLALHAYAIGSGTRSVNYAVFQVTPLRYV